MKFIKITVDCTTLISDTVAFVLHEAGSMGEVFDDYADIKHVLDDKRWDYADARLFDETDGCRVSGYFTIETDEAAVTDKLSALRAETWADFSSISWHIEIIDSVTWENEWKKYYKPFNIGNIVIVPEWIDHTPSNNDIQVKLNPGLAFGTGMHETTSMCIDLMQKIELTGKRVLDFGCGSGILGICAAKLGARSTVFADNDEQAISATEYKCRLNGMVAPETYLKDVRDMNEPADIVIANITADVLISVEQIIKNTLKNGGHVIISGIISNKRSDVLNTYVKDFELIESLQKNEWSAFLFKL